MTPFLVVYDRKPSSLLDYDARSIRLEVLDTTLTNINVIIRTLKGNLTKAQYRMKTQKQKNRQDITFESNDWVLPSLQPYFQDSVSHRTGQKALSTTFWPV